MGWWQMSVKMKIERIIVWTENNKANKAGGFIAMGRLRKCRHFLKRFWAMSNARYFWTIFFLAGVMLTPR